MELGNGKINKFFALPEEDSNKYYIDDFDVDANKYNNNVYLLSEQVPECSVVLDIGCGSGKFGKRLKTKECIVYGIEMDTEAVKYAEATECYKKIFICDITDKESVEYKKFRKTVEKVDVIIISDVLEHLQNPTQVLIDCYQYLKDNGTILISIPNIAHIDITMNLLNGKFNYTDMGILDNSHLKFFTRSSFVEWINQINNQIINVKYDVEYIGGILYNSDLVEKIRKDYLELSKILECVKDYNALELLFKLKKIDKKSAPININRLLNEESIDVIKLLSDCLDKNYQSEKIKAPLILSERMLYQDKLDKIEDSLSWHIEKIQEVNKALEWYQRNTKEAEEEKNTKDKYINDLEESINWHIEKIQEVNVALEWYQKAFYETQEEVEKQKKDINELDVIKKQNLELKKIIFEMENSFSWKITKFLRKNKRGL